MRTLLLAAVCAFPIVSLFYLASRSLDQAQEKPEPAAIMFTAGTAKEWLENEPDRCIRAVLRDTRKRNHAVTN